MTVVVVLRKTKVSILSCTRIFHPFDLCMAFATSPQDIRLEDFHEMDCSMTGFASAQKGLIPLPFPGLNRMYKERVSTAKIPNRIYVSSTSKSPKTRGYEYTDINIKSPSEDEPKNL